MFVTIINDCCDENAAGRQLTRVAALFEAPAALVGVGSYGDLEAAGNLVDVLDASEGKSGVVLVNVAPRHGRGKHFENGTPFCYFRVGETLVLASVDGLTLSLAKKLDLLETITVFDVASVGAVLAKAGIIAPEEATRITGSQFRSFDVLPRAAFALARGVELPGTILSLTKIVDAPRAVWFVDNFGNCKTTLLLDDLADTASLSIGAQNVPVTASLKDVPDGEAAAIVGSSGFGDRRFVEVVMQGGRADEAFGLSVGASLDH